MKSRGLGRIEIILEEVKAPFQSSEDKFFIEPLMEGDFPVILESLTNQPEIEAFTLKTLMKFVEVWEKYVSKIQR